MKRLILIFLIAFILLTTGCLEGTVQSGETEEETVEGYDMGEIEDIDIDELDELGEIEIPDDL